MKYLLALLLLPSVSFACLNKVSPADMKKVIDAGSYSAAETLTYQGEDAVCIDGKNLLDHDLIDGELVFNPDKAFARELAEQNAQNAQRAKEAAKLAAMARLKAANADNATTVAALRAIVKDMKILLEE